METLLSRHPNEAADAAPAPVAHDVPAADLPLGEHLRRWAAHHGARTALVAGGARMTFAALDRR
ncbi:hypothetical protein C2I33_23560, partial [Ralstonia solanacearum]